MKAILMSIKTRHNRNIETGLKISELRTLPPNLPTPFKVFTYESGFDGRHKVVNEWICNNITTWRICMGIPSHLPKAACISADEIYEYSKHGLKDISEMRISNLKIYDKPKEITEFYAAVSLKDIKCKYKEQRFKTYNGKPYYRCNLQNCVCEFSRLGRQTDCEGFKNTRERHKLTRPPQSWCYVEDTF